MINLRLLLVTLIVAMSHLSQAAELKVVSWNLEWFPGKKPNATEEQSTAHVDQAQDALISINPDILLLQGVRDWDSVQKAVSVFPGLTVDVLSSFKEGNRPGKQQVAIVSNLPVNSSWSEYWKSGTADPPRGFAFAALELPDGRLLLAYSLHLKSNAGGDPATNIAKREDSSRQLLEHIKSMEAIYGKTRKLAILVGGDFNTSLDDKRFGEEQTLRQLQTAGMTWTGDGVPFEERITLPAEGKWPAACFDHIFVRGLGKLKAHSLPFPGISDHFPVGVMF